MNNTILANDIRPKSLDDIIGQEHLIGNNKIISNLVKNKKLFSMILYGKPGVGKTSIAIAIVNDLNCRYRMLNAVINNKKDFDVVIEEAKMYNGLIVIIDEIHRMNKDKQDLLLPYLESGIITLIGMTTSNPYHSINAAIRSRCQIFELKDLTHDNIVYALKKVVKNNLLQEIKIDEECFDYIANASGCDLRNAYNLLEIAYFSNDNHHIDKTTLEMLVSKTSLIYDKNGDGYYDLLSALQKSIRGSDVHASIYYLARLIEGGDIDAICRRLSVIVYEDIGLANCNMGPKVDAAINCSLRVGLPEARIILSAIVIEMALSPKSNSAEVAIDEALNDIRKGNNYDIPKHLKNPSSTYLYPHNYPNSYVKQQYLPDNLVNKKYYHPRNNKNEIVLKNIMEKLSSFNH